MNDPVDVYRPRNPFRSANIRPGANRFVFREGETPETVLAALGTLACGQIVGPHGSGKSTLLAELARHLRSLDQRIATSSFDGPLRSKRDRDAAYRALFRESIRETEWVLIDGLEQLPWFARWCLIRHLSKAQKKTIVTSHRDLGLTTIYRTIPSVEVAERVVSAICERERVPLIFSRAEIARIWDTHGGNLRELLFALYDQQQSKLAY